MVNIDEMYHWRHLHCLLAEGEAHHSWETTLKKPWIVCQGRSYCTMVGFKEPRVEEWAMSIIQAMCSNAWSRVQINCQYSEEFGMGDGGHQGSVLSPLRFFLVLEALSHEFCTGVPWELLYTDDQVLIPDTQEECISKLKAWKAGVESKGLRVNMKMTKFLVSGDGHDGLGESGKYPCAVCCSGVGRNSILCSQCMLWVHKTCSGITKRPVKCLY